MHWPLAGCRYQKYNSILAEASEEADAMREFFSCKGTSADSTVGAGVADELSCISASEVAAGSVGSSVLCCVNIGALECEVRPYNR